VLHEIGAAAQLAIEVDEPALPVREPVRALCEVLGLDPLFLASEGRCVAFVPEAEAEAALAAMRGHALGVEAARIGTVQPGPPRVVVRTRAGTRRLLLLPAGDPLPRIC
jgi:hydrogenase expression/formation protein HypE